MTGPNFSERSGLAQLAAVAELVDTRTNQPENITRIAARPADLQATRENQSMVANRNIQDPAHQSAAQAPVSHQHARTFHPSTPVLANISGYPPGNNDCFQGLTTSNAARNLHYYASSEQSHPGYFILCCHLQNPQQFHRNSPTSMGQPLESNNSQVSPPCIQALDHLFYFALSSALSTPHPQRGRVPTVQPIPEEDDGVNAAVRHQQVPIAPTNIVTATGATSKRSLELNQNFDDVALRQPAKKRRKADQAPSPRPQDCIMRNSNTGEKELSNRKADSTNPHVNSDEDFFTTKAKEGQLLQQQKDSEDGKNVLYKLGVDIVSKLKLSAVQDQDNLRLPGGSCLVAAACYILGRTTTRLLKELLDDMNLLPSRGEFLKTVYKSLRKETTKLIADLNKNVNQDRKRYKIAAKRICEQIGIIIIKYRSKKIMEELEDGDPKLKELEKENEELRKRLETEQKENIVLKRDFEKAKNENNALRKKLTAIEAVLHGNGKAT